jgi:hypothetical protein
MVMNWHPEEDATPTPREVETLASVLEARHGLLAAEIAEFFSAYHGVARDAGRCWAWAGVAETIRRRVKSRVIAG